MPFITTLIETVGAKVLIGVFLVASLATSGYAGAKLYTSVVSHPTSKSQQQIGDQPTVQKDTPAPTVVQNVDNDGGHALSASGPTGVLVRSAIRTATAGTKTPTPFPTMALLPTQKPLSASTSTNSCIVTLFGQQFDVTQLRSTHSGGNIFTCGTDMTATYQSKHGTSLARMARYAVASGSGSVPGSSSGGTIGSTGPSGIVGPSSVSFREEERDDDDKHDSFGHSEENEHESREREDSEDDE
jgi:hypothetical protein